MGWTGIHTDCRSGCGRIDRKATVRKEMFGNWPGYSLVVDGMHGSTYYAAVREEATGEVFALVVLTQTDDRDYYNFLYKEMTETCGPGEHDCPKKVLDALTPTDDEWANAWRDRCREKIAEASAPGSFKKLPEGATAKWTVPEGSWSYVKPGDVLTLVKQRLNPRKGSPFVWKVMRGTYPQLYLKPSQVAMADLEMGVLA